MTFARQYFFKQNPCQFDVSVSILFQKLLTFARRYFFKKNHLTFR